MWLVYNANHLSVAILSCLLGARKHWTLSRLATGSPRPWSNRLIKLCIVITYIRFIIPCLERSALVLVWFFLPLGACAFNAGVDIRQHPRLRQLSCAAAACFFLEVSNNLDSWRHLESAKKSSRSSADFWSGCRPAGPPGMVQKH